MQYGRGIQAFVPAALDMLIGSLSLALVLSVVSAVRAVPPPPAPVHHRTCYDDQGNQIECHNSLVTWIISLSVAGAVVIAIILYLTYPKCKRRMQEKKAKTLNSSQKYQQLSEPADTNFRTTAAEHNPGAPYDPPVNSLPYSYPSGYTPSHVEYEYKAPTQQPMGAAEPVHFPTAQIPATSAPPSYEPPTYVPRTTA